MTNIDKLIHHAKAEFIRQHGEYNYDEAVGDFELGIKWTLEMLNKTGNGDTITIINDSKLDIDILSGVLNYTIKKGFNNG